MKSQRTTWILAGVLLAAAVVWNGARVVAASRADEATDVPRLSAGDVQPFWWTFLGAESTASLWLGPPTAQITGERTRPWTLVCTRPGTEEPLACLQGSAAVGDAEPIGYRTERVSVELRPLDDLTWGQVASKESLDVQIEGFR